MSFQVIAMQPRTLSWWRDEREDVDLEPAYQRKGQVWSLQQKQYLIDSILNGFDIPKLYFADFTFFNSQLNEGKKKYAVIDGKQRMLAIFDFFDDKFTLAKTFVYSEDPGLKIGGFSYSDILKNYPKLARKFDNASLTVMSVITDDEPKINELFVRLNSSKPLTGAEVRSAMGGRLPVIINELVTHPFFARKINFGTNRSQDKNTVTKLLLLEHRGSIVDTKKGQLDSLVLEGFGGDENMAANGAEGSGDRVVDEVIGETEGGDLERSAERVKRVLDRLASAFIDDDPLLKQSSQIVMIYWLARDLSDDEMTKLRPFLIQFEGDRSVNRKASTSAELSEYEINARTSNDAFSIKRRDQILRGRFQAFLEQQQARQLPGVSTQP